MVLFIFFVFEAYKDTEVISLAVERFENEGDNGREKISEEVINQFLSSGTINFLFGYGYTATVKLNRVPSHNDYLEIIYDFGIFAIIPYCALILLLILKCIKWFKYRLVFMEYYLCYLTSLIILVGLSLFNYMIFSVYSMVLFFSIGISYAYITSKIKI
jgi:O-antigen ligase